MYIPINVCTCWYVNLSCATQASQIRIRFNLILCFISMWQRNHTKNHNTFLSMHQFQTRNTCAVSTSLKTPEPKEQGQAKRAGKVRRWTFVTMFKQDINPPPPLEYSFSLCTLQSTLLGDPSRFLNIFVYFTSLELPPDSMVCAVVRAMCRIFVAFVYCFQFSPSRQMTNVFSHVHFTRRHQHEEQEQQNKKLP